MGKIKSTWISYSTISSRHEIEPILGVSIDATFRSSGLWWMASSLPWQDTPPDQLGSVIQFSGLLWGGHTSYESNGYQRPALHI